MSSQPKGSTGGSSSNGSSSNAPVKKECTIPGKSIYSIWRSDFEIDSKYVVRLHVKLVVSMRIVVEDILYDYHI